MKVNKISSSFNSFDDSKSISPKIKQKMFPIKTIPKTNEITHFSVKKPINLQKCFKPILGNKVMVEKEGFIRQICSNLICSKCNVQISHFDNFLWKSSCDYLFFRTYFGLKEKIVKGLMNKEKCRAYHCGCSGVSVENAVFVEEIENLKWICLGHE